MSDREIIESKYGTMSYDQSGVMDGYKKKAAYTILSVYDEESILLAAEIVKMQRR